MRNPKQKLGHPEEWLKHAISDLTIAKESVDAKVLNNSLCYLAQQAVEKALKAIKVKAKKFLSPKFR